MYLLLCTAVLELVTRHYMVSGEYPSYCTFSAFTHMVLWSAGWLLTTLTIIFTKLRHAAPIRVGIRGHSHNRTRKKKQDPAPSHLQQWRPPSTNPRHSRPPPQPPRGAAPSSSTPSTTTWCTTPSSTTTAASSPRPLRVSRLGLQSVGRSVGVARPPTCTHARACVLKSQGRMRAHGAHLI